MRHLIVVNSAKEWPVEIEDSEVVPARTYLTDPAYSTLRPARVYNLCRTYRYQSIGYYVSLLAAARGHKPMPGVPTILDLRNQTYVRFVSDDLDDQIQKSMRPLASSDFTLSIYFGRNLAKKYDRLSSILFKLFPAPFLRAHFVYTDKWQMTSVRAVPTGEIPPEHLDFAMEMTRNFFRGKRVRTPKLTNSTRFDMAILYNPHDDSGPSDEKAIAHFSKAAESLGIGTELIGRDDYGRLTEFDALFIRESTQVNHHTFRFARRAAAEGLVVIDDPESIMMCTNKVFLAELLARHSIPTPRSLVVHQKNRLQVVPTLGLPCILKQPDSYYSLGVEKANTEEETQRALDRLFDTSDLIIAQEFLPTDFDWRVTIIDRRVLFACKYHMVRKHWQIARRVESGVRYGKVEVVPLEEVPDTVLRVALKAANLIGDGFYGVDIKQDGRNVYIIEVNDNPSVDAGYEDVLLKDELYLQVMKVFLKRIEQRKQLRS